MNHLILDGRVLRDVGGIEITRENSNPRFAVTQNGAREFAKLELFKMAAATVSRHPEMNFVINTEE